jgi:hypothetical protein
MDATWTTQLGPDILQMKTKLREKQRPLIKLYFTSWKSYKMFLPVVMHQKEYAGLLL